MWGGGGEAGRRAGGGARRAGGPGAEAGPALRGRVAGGKKQPGRGGPPARHEQEPRVLALELREVEERVALAEIVVLDVIALELALVRGRHQHDAAADAGQQRPPPGGAARRVDGAAPARQPRYRGPAADRRRRGR